MKQVRKKAVLWTVAGILLAALCAVIFAVLYREHQIKITPVANDGLTVEAGIDALPQASEYFSYLGAFDEASAELRYTPTGQSDAFTTKSLSEEGDNSAVATSLGTYTVTIICDGFTDEFTSSLTVVDTTVPVLTLKDVFY